MYILYFYWPDKIIYIFFVDFQFFLQPYHIISKDGSFHLRSGESTALLPSAFFAIIFWLPCRLSLSFPLFLFLFLPSPHHPPGELLGRWLSLNLRLALSISDQKRVLSQGLELCCGRAELVRLEFQFEFKIGSCKMDYRWLWGWIGPDDGRHCDNRPGNAQTTFLPDQNHYRLRLGSWV